MDNAITLAIDNDMLLSNR